MFEGVAALVKKEIRALLKEPQSVAMIFGPIFLFLTLFVFATTKDVENTSIVVLNEDSGIYSTEIMEKVVSTKVFKDVQYVYDRAEFEKLINAEKAFIGIVFDKSFSKDIMNNQRTKSAGIQIITDGRRTNSAVIAQSYLTRIISKMLLAKNSPSASIRSWYNPNKEATWFSITNLVCMLISNQAISIVALAIAREKERGTFEQLLVTPISPLGMLIGKMVPGMAIGMFMGFFVMFLAHALYGVPIAGNVALMFICMLVYVFAVVGIGVFISAFANTQQQASLGMFVALLPLASLSGLTCPVEAITNPFFKAFSMCNPLVYASKLVRGFMIKDISIHDAWLNVYPLLIIGFVLLIVSATVFARTHKIKVF
ncbi:MAG: ABC transporter permease [Holosporales bacterium]|jgi:ABC-2 type transport system permease protein|nr:ABC transporter permease [Holosporales bacterium]